MNDESRRGDRSVHILPTRLTEDALRLDSNSDDVCIYGCGHLACSAYVLIFKNRSGEEFNLDFNEEVRARREQCGACVLERLLKTSIPCSSCGTLILVGQQVNTMRGGIRCMNTRCSSPFDLSGNWDGAQVVPITINIGGPMF
jgi:hypothetical protein